MCPSDGKVLHFGRVDSGGRLEQVKGVTYQLKRFLGDLENNKMVLVSDSAQDVGVSKDSDRERHLYHVILYLAPGDYHHFHSPADWTIHTRRHFPGISSFVGDVD